MIGLVGEVELGGAAAHRDLRDHVVGGPGEALAGAGGHVAVDLKGDLNRIFVPQI